MIDNLHDFCRSQAAENSHNFCPPALEVDEQSSNRQRVHSHALLRPLRIDGIARNELVDPIELGFGFPIQLSDSSVDDSNLWRRIIRTVEEDEPRLRPFVN